MSDNPCKFCGGPIPLEWERCPHCARPGLYPNVKEARDKTKQKEVRQRYNSALHEATLRGAEETVRDFEQAVHGSQAVVARPLRDIDRITSSDRELFATFYGLTEGEVRLPFGDKWDRLRRQADVALFPGYEKHIRFAALSLDGVGLTEFGECSMVLRDDMVAHRASVFEDNSAALMEIHHKEPTGYRATWAERSKLCAAKLGGELQPDTSPSEFPRILLYQKSEHEESRFVEVHIWGSMSVRTVGRVLLIRSRGRRKPRKAFELALRDQLAKVGLTLETA